MKIQLIAVGQKMPRWIQEGFAEYAKRFPPEISFSLIEIPAEKRGKKADIERITDKEGEKMLAAIPKGNRVITLEVEGKAWSTHDLSERFQAWQLDGRDVSLLVGGPEGLAPACLAARDERWSLSPLTLPHPVVRVIIAESLFRAWSLLNNHPYHRE